MAKFRLRDDGGGEEIIEAEDLEDAKQLARLWAENGDWDMSGGTIWVDVDISEVIEACDHPRMGSPTDRVDANTCTECGESCDCDDGEPSEVDSSECPIHGASDEEWNDVGSVTVAIDPSEPECRDGKTHDWKSPISIVGGIAENPGVQAHGGGVVIEEICIQCGCGKTTDTWAQNPSNGKQGLTSISYEEGAHDVPWIYDDEHVVRDEEIELAEKSGACESALEWLRANAGGITVADVRARNRTWYDWAVAEFGWES